MESKKDNVNDKPVRQPCYGFLEESDGSDEEELVIDSPLSINFFNMMDNKKRKLRRRKRLSRLRACKNKQDDGSSNQMVPEFPVLDATSLNMSNLKRLSICLRYYSPFFFFFCSLIFLFLRCVKVITLYISF